jgi:hypothetical protein
MGKNKGKLVDMKKEPKNRESGMGLSSRGEGMSSGAER